MGLKNQKDVITKCFNRRIYLRDHNDIIRWGRVVNVFH